jgi:hypothetical protein
MPTARLATTPGRSNMNRKSCFTFVLLVSVFFIRASGDAHAATYYISPSGNDSNRGGISSPFRTIQQCANVASGGDTCMIRGGIYRETVRPANSGWAGAPITFKGYQGETVVVSGADRVTGWSGYNGAIYKASVPWNTEQVFVDGHMMIEARWPNTGLDLFHPNLAVSGSGTGRDPNTGIETVYDAALNFPPGFWNGGVIWIQANSQPGHIAWWAQTQRISDSGPGYVAFPSLPIDSANPDITRIPGPGNGYYLKGRLEALDAPTEWFHDNSSGMLYLWTPAGDNPSGHTVDAKRREFAFDLSGRSFITLEDVNIFAATISMKGTDHCTVDHINAKYIWHARETLPNAWGVNYDRHIDRSLWTTAGIGYSGIVMTGSNNRLINSQIAYSYGAAVVFSGNNHLIQNNIIHHINYSGSGMPGIGGHGSVGGISILNNRVYDVGRDVIGGALRASSVKYNDLYNGLLLTSDGALLYVQRAIGDGTEIAYNYVHDSASPQGVSIGIYLDNASTGFVVHHNSVWNIPDAGIFLYSNHFTDPNGMVYDGSNNRVYNNSIFHCGYNILHACIMTADDPPYPDDPASIKFINNAVSGSMQLINGVTTSNNMVSPTDPVFVDPWQGNLQLRSNSPAIDAGTYIPGITNNAIGAPDIGAYEYGAALWFAGPTGVAFPNQFPYPVGGSNPPPPSPTPPPPQSI